MFVRSSSFDALLTDKKGQVVEVDCSVKVPVSSGAPAGISIEMPLGDRAHESLENPCVLTGSDGEATFEVSNLWYRSIPVGAPHRRHARGRFEILHAGQLRVKQNHSMGGRGSVRFLLSPLRFFKAHSKASLVNYATTPDMAVELFALHTSDLGVVRFRKYWSIEHVDERGISGEIRASFVVEVDARAEDRRTVDCLVDKMKAVLTPLSILTKQAITLHGWVWDAHDGVECSWFNPLDPNLAPDMGEQDGEHVCFPNEFDDCAQALVNAFLSSTAKVREALTVVAVALAPHVKRSRSESFLALFSAFDQLLSLQKLTREERQALRQTDEELVGILNNLRLSVEAQGGGNAEVLALRIEGLTRSIRSSGPSFKVRFEKFQTAFPVLRVYMADLWPVLGSDNAPGLKQIRDSLAHRLRHEFGEEVTVVANFHLVLLLERLVFIVLGLNVPRGIRRDSMFLAGDSWYQASEWQAIRDSVR